MATSTSSRKRLVASRFTRIWAVVQEIAAILGVSPDFVWGLIRAGSLRARRLGRFLVVSDADLRAYAEGLPFAAVVRPVRPVNVTPIRQPRTRRQTARVQKLVYPLAGSQP